jgi:hypothetical protein
MCSFKYKSYLVHSFPDIFLREAGRLSLIPRHRGKAGGKQKKSASLNLAALSNKRRNKSNKRKNSIARVVVLCKGNVSGRVAGFVWVRKEVRSIVVGILVRLLLGRA